MPKGGFPSMQVIISSGVFNAQDGTCYYLCSDCCGLTNPQVIPEGLAFTIGLPLEAVMSLEDCEGDTVDPTEDADRYADSYTAYNGIQPDGEAGFTGTGVGDASLEADYFGNVPPDPHDSDCTCGCPQADFDQTGGVGILPVISGPGSVWWFNGESPSGYATSITLTTSPGANFGWQIDTGADEISTSSLTGSTLTITATGSDFSSSLGSVEISVIVDGMTSGGFLLTPREPYQLVPLTPAFVDESNPTYGYDTQALYTIGDQTKALLPVPVPLHEQWTGATVSDYAGTNWGWGEAGALVSGGTQGLPPSAFEDFMTGRAASPPGFTPIPLPGYTGGSPVTPVNHTGQAWWIGSASQGHGVVQTDVLQRYINAARHLVIYSPFNPLP